MEWTYSLGNDTVLLEHKPFWAVAVETFITWTPLENVLLELPYGYSVWNGILIWTDKWRDERLELPITPEQRERLNNDDAWVDDGDAASMTFAKERKPWKRKRK